MSENVTRIELKEEINDNNFWNIDDNQTIQHDNDNTITPETFMEIANNEREAPFTGNSIKKEEIEEEDVCQGNHLTNSVLAVENYPDENEYSGDEGEERKTLLNYLKDIENRQTREEEYPKIPHEGILIPRVDHLKCSEIRWFYKSQNSGLVPLSDHDSLLTEIKYRMKKGIKLDNDAEKIQEKELPHLSKPQLADFDFGFEQTDSNSSVSSTSSNEDFLDQGESALVVDEGYYRVSKKNKYIHPVYWKKEKKKLIRGYYFISDNDPIEPKVAEKINEHISEFLSVREKKEAARFSDHLVDDEQTKQFTSGEQSTQSSGIGSNCVPRTLVIGQATIEFSSLIDFTIRQDGGHPMSVGRYCRPAKWTEPRKEIDNLVFVVHGILHDKKEEHIVDCVKQMKKNLGPSTGILFLPIHWRTNLKDNEHVCTSACASRWFVTEDAKLYNCSYYGSKIRNIVISHINGLYRKFKTLNPDFNGNVSFLGHSLGSIICYDILTMDYLEEKRKEFEFKPVKHFFAVGSPLWAFLENRGKEAKAKFRTIMKSIRIYNIYHESDKIASRLEPIINENYINEIAVEIPDVPQPWSIANIFNLSKTNGIFHGVRALVSKIISTPNESNHELRYRMDFKLQGLIPCGSYHAHSIYWDQPSFSNFIRNVFSKEKYEHQGQKPTNKNPLNNNSNYDESSCPPSKRPRL